MANSATTGRVLPHEFVDQLMREVRAPLQRGREHAPETSSHSDHRAWPGTVRRLVRVPAVGSEEAVLAGRTEP